MPDQRTPYVIPFDLEHAVETARLRRAAVAASHLGTAGALATLVDRLGELHADLDADDAFHQSLHALTFVWQHFEQELHIVAQGKN